MSGLKRWFYVGDLAHYKEGKILDVHHHSIISSSLSEPVYLAADVDQVIKRLTDALKEIATFPRYKMPSDIAKAALNSLEE